MASHWHTIEPRERHLVGARLDAPSTSRAVYPERSALRFGPEVFNQLPSLLRILVSRSVPSRRARLLVLLNTSR